MTQYQYPNIVAGLEVPKAILDAFLVKTTIKDNDTDAISDTTVTDDPELFLNDLEANGVYEIRFFIKFSGDLDGDLRTQWSVPSGATGSRLCVGPGTTAADASADNMPMRMGVYATSSAVAYSCARDSTSNSQWCFETALIRISSTAGDIALSWSQNTTSPTATRVTSDSWATARRLA
jgi:hypothetical protein